MVWAIAFAPRALAARRRARARLGRATDGGPTRTLAPGPAAFRAGRTGVRGRLGIVRRPPRRARTLAHAVGGSAQGELRSRAARHRRGGRRGRRCPQGWDEDRVRRHLERGVASGAQLLRRARWLCLLGDCSVAWREPGARPARRRGGPRRDRRRARPRSGRASSGFARCAEHGAIASVRSTPARYDRMRVLATELKRVLAMGARSRSR